MALAPITSTGEFDFIRAWNSTTIDGEPLPTPLEVISFGKELAVRFENAAHIEQGAGWKAKLPKGVEVKAKKYKSPLHTIFKVSKVSLAPAPRVVAAVATAFPEDNFRLFQRTVGLTRVDEFYIAFYRAPKKHPPTPP
ncbi:hypothetical protein AYL99_09758 [Fonsecaea erecta]|uniref:Uncharacterized protein n=1 Tax=Fonsecaea erecta TaxID=1367422 RepID=A0A178Z772_9EURO|nr:hypothetical protein AYL99_09758 [Fonsecaea erecta]OAP55607.1 hypothetical protein AYL99_09758 [Fonsecaea erecta]